MNLPHDLTDSLYNFLFSIFRPPFHNIDEQQERNARPDNPIDNIFKEGYLTVTRNHRKHIVIRVHRCL